MTNASAAQHPTELPPGYEIRRLTTEHSQWASAILCHSNIFHSKIFSVCYPEDQTKRFNQMMAAATYLVDHQIESGMSFGVFDLNHRYKRPESADAGGKFYWNPEDDTPTSQDLIEAMDFPLVSVALAYDGGSPLDLSRLGPLVQSLPLFATILHALDVADPRDPATWKANGLGQVLMRNGTSTRHDHEGKGLMSACAKYLMKEVKAKGYKAINIECLNDAVTHVWSSPPAPFEGQVVAEVSAASWVEKDEDGELVKPFAPSEQRITRVYVSL